MVDKLSVTNKTKQKIPVLPLLVMKNKVLGKKYHLSIAFVSKTISRKINKTYRKKDRATNVLSFVISKNKGELVLCPELIKHESKNKGKSVSKNYREWFEFLVIHGMLHLKGLRHGKKMEKEEERYLSHTKFFIK